MQSLVRSAQSADTVETLLSLLLGLTATSGLLLLEADPTLQQAGIIGAGPAGIAGREIQLTPALLQRAGQGPGDIDGLSLPSAFTRWLGGRPTHLMLEPLPDQASRHYLLACWAGALEPTSRAAEMLQQSTGLFPHLINFQQTATHLGEMADRLGIVMNNVALGIAFLDTGGHCTLNAIAAALLALPVDTIDAARFAAGMRETRSQCEIQQSEHLAAQDIYGEVIVPQAEIWILPGRAKVVQVESRATGDTRNPGRFWVFTDITAIWNNGERLRHLNDRLQETNDRLEAEIIERHRVEVALREREAELQRYTEDLEISRASIEKQASEAVEMAEILAEQKLALEHSKQQSDFLANHDALTGLFNRRAFNTHLYEMLERSKTSHSRIGVMFIDLDKFKLVNDTLGHGRGDELLKQVAAGLNGILRDTDLVARLGGDEFAIATRLPPNKKPDLLPMLAERIRLGLQISVAAPGATIQVCATIGVALYPEDAGDADAILIEADKAMYAGKQRGRNVVVFYHDLPKAEA